MKSDNIYLIEILLRFNEMMNMRGFTLLYSRESATASHVYRPDYRIMKLYILMKNLKSVTGWRAEFFKNYMNVSKINLPRG